MDVGSKGEAMIDEDKATEIVAIYLQERSVKRTAAITGISPRRVQAITAGIPRGKPGPRMSAELREAVALAELYLDSTGSAPWRALARRADVEPSRLRELVFGR
jgi:hypothetical protein